MADSEDMRLQRMGLVQLQDTENDEVVGEEEYMPTDNIGIPIIVRQVLRHEIRF